MYTDRAFVQDGESGVLEMNQTVIPESLMAQYGVSACLTLRGVQA